jgi:large exoprotein involved in heme utilization and adhesion
MISSKSDLPRFLTTVLERKVGYGKNTHQWTAGVLRVGEAIALTGIMWAIAPGNNALAQIKPDGTLGAEGSAVTENVMLNGGLADRVNGGATRGTNLFHSFEQFNIANGQRVYFANPAGIENRSITPAGVNLLGESQSFTI